MGKNNRPYPPVSSVVVRPVKGRIATIGNRYENRFEVVSITPAEEIRVFNGNYFSAVESAALHRGNLIRDFDMYPDTHLVTKFRSKISAIFYQPRNANLSLFDIKIVRSDKGPVVYAITSDKDVAEKCVEHLAKLVESGVQVDAPKKSTVNLSRFQRMSEDEDEV